jgi:hypothetical protein
VRVYGCRVLWYDSEEIMREHRNRFNTCGSMLVIWTALTKLYSHMLDSNFKVDVLSGSNTPQVQSLLSHGFTFLGSDLFLA